jgi:hypothetical protein
MEKTSQTLAYQLNTMLKKEQYKNKHPIRVFWPRMSCTKLCGWSLVLQRFHITCIWCRARRFFYGKIDRSKYHINSRFAGIVLPNDSTLRIIFKKVYGDRVFFVKTLHGWKRQKLTHILMDERPVYHIWVDNNRQFKSFKEIFFDKVFKKTEVLVNTENLSFLKQLWLRFLYNMIEMLAN